MLQKVQTKRQTDGHVRGLTAHILKRTASFKNENRKAAKPSALAFFKAQKVKKAFYFAHIAI